MAGYTGDLLHTTLWSLAYVLMPLLVGRKGFCFCVDQKLVLRFLNVYSPMSNCQAVYLIIVDPHPQEDIRAFSVVVLTSEPGSRAHYCSIP